MTTPSVRLTSQDRLEGSLILEHRRSGSGHVAIVSRITDRARQAGQIIAEEVTACWAALTRAAEMETFFSGSRIHSRCRGPRASQPARHLYPIADAIALQNTVESPANGCGPCSMTCSLRRFHSASKVLTNEMNPTSFSNVLLCEV